jgi:predicted RNase H-like HicB family nuclease
MSKPNYRVILTFDGDRKVFVARAPELEHCTAEGATRAEASAKLEEEIDAQLANMLSHGSTPPRAVDEETFSGEVTAKLSKALHRDLAYQARSEGIDLDHLVGELLSAALESRKHTHRAQRGGNRHPQEHGQHDNIGNRHDAPRGGGGGGGGRGFGRNNYNSQLLDDRANFIEYVRGLEQQGGHGGPARGPGGGPRNDDRRRRRGGRGGGGGGGGPRHDQRPFHQQRNGNPGQPQQQAAPSAPPPPAPPSGDSDGNS